MTASDQHTEAFERFVRASELEEVGGAAPLIELGRVLACRLDRGGATARAAAMHRAVLGELRRYVRD